MLPYLATGPTSFEGNDVQLLLAEEIQFIDNGSAGLLDLHS
jgi:hypothetical protein